ncbi:MAG TPA: hypothetical protein VG498_08205 [Terriglobales bacterium]|nr:hypothetical protein [Terriglobales bacterium]
MPTSELPHKVGRNKPSHQEQNSLILLFVGGEYAGLESVLRRHGYTVVVPSTADQAVALCPYNHLVAALLDRKTLAESSDWSLAQSLKAVARDVPVLLLVQGDASGEQNLPAGVDLAANAQDPLKVIQALSDYSVRSGRERVG